MEQKHSVDTRHGIADALIRGVSLLVGYSAQDCSLTCRTVLAMLAEDGPTRLTTLVAGTGVSQPSMTQCVGRMQREGLVVRLIDPEDARATLIDLTDAGRARRTELLGSVHDRLAELLDTLSPHDETTLGMAMRVALPILEQLTREAAQQARSLSAFAR